MNDDEELRLACARLAVDLCKAAIAAAMSARATDLQCDPVVVAKSLYGWVKERGDVF